ncbi:MAG: 1,2-phenylacetyl-CoA epoxidase subunit PaaC [Lautropia sp.]|nr:1,2-phenylacetyl-CoA epoxidase subunit PaaC [Lautropia sp.]
MLREFCLRMGDNTLVLAQRISAWCGHAPVLEEDIAMANVALDLIGQTQYWLGLAGRQDGYDQTADQLAYFRDVFDFRNFLLVEQPDTDYACTLMRQFLFDAWHVPQLEALCLSRQTEVADIALKAVKEASYHLERSSDLVMRLGDGSEESHQRMQRALNLLWPYTGEFFSADSIDRSCAEQGIAPDPLSIQTPWLECVELVLKEGALNIPEDGYMHSGGKAGKHTEHLGYLLAEMQFLQRAYPGCEW